MQWENFFTYNAPASIACFIVFGLLACGFATLMTKIAVAIKDKAKISDGVIGGILIGAITSIPELITSITVIVSSFIDPDVHPWSVFGDIIGSNMFCFLIMAVVLLFTVVIFKKRQADQINTLSLIFMMVGTLFCFMACIFEKHGQGVLVWHGFNFFTIFIFLSYAMAVYTMLFGAKARLYIANSKRFSKKINVLKAQKIKPSPFLKLRMPVLIALLVGSVVLLTLSSVILGSSCTGIIIRENLGEVFGRTLLLGIATSLPELIAVITLAIDKRYNMVIDSMVGSCAFNMTILFISNVVYSIMYVPGSESMYVFDVDSASQLILFLLEAAFLVLYLVANSKSIKRHLTNHQVVAINSILLSLTILSYLSYIALGLVQQFTK